MGLLIAKLISNIANPFTLSFPASYLLVYAVSHNVEYSLKWAATAFAFAIIVMVFVVLGVKKGIFSDIDVSKQKHRYLLYFLILSGLFLYLIFLFIFNGPKILFIVTFIFILAALIMNFISKWIKASIHVATIAVFCVILSIVYQGWYALSLIFIPITIWARIKTKRHTFPETIFGTLLGAFFAIVSHLAISKLNL